YSNKAPKYTPNGQMFIMSNGPICRAYPDGSIETTTNIYNDRGVMYISPREDIHLRNRSDSYDGLGPVCWIVERIDYITYNLYTIQHLSESPPGSVGNSHLAVFTPEGDYVALVHANYMSAAVVVYPILETGLLDTTRRQTFPNGNALSITPDGNYIYIARGSTNELAILRRILGAGFEDTGWRVSLVAVPTIMRMSPDGKFLVVEYKGGSYVDHIKVYAIQSDGSLIEAFDLPFQETFGDGLDGLEFAYPLGPTAVEPNQWQLYE
ncbi:MAG: hypothetical protein QME64_12990, partial [bacterium]|nr:hypothetical protein [bacterium]